LGSFYLCLGLYGAAPIVYYLYSLSYSISLLFLVRLCCWILGDPTLDLVGTFATSFLADLGRQNLIDTLFTLFSCLDVHESKKSFDSVSTNEVDVKFVTYGNGSLNFFLLSLVLLRPLQRRRTYILFDLSLVLSFFLVFALVLALDIG